MLLHEFNKLNKNKYIFIESESSKIGNLFLPSTLLSKIENSPCIDIETTVEANMFLVKDYNKFVLNKNSFNGYFLTQKKLGKDVVNKWKANYKSKKWKELALQLIIEYYDPLYSHKKNQKNNSVIEYLKLKNLSKNSINKLCKYLIKQYL